MPLLDKLGEKYDYTVEGLPLLVLDDVTISSTAIRALLAAGDVAEAARLLGRPHRVEGVVVRGHQRGRQLGFPTANVESPPHTAIPADGIYAGWLATLDEAGAETPPLARRDLDRHQPDVRRAGRTVEAYALAPHDLDLYGAARGDRLRHPAARHPPLRLDRGPGRADAPRRRPGKGNLRGTSRVSRNRSVSCVFPWPDRAPAHAWYRETLPVNLPVRAGCTLIAAARHGETRTL